MVITQEQLTGTFEQKKALVSQFNLMDDDFFSVVMMHKDACEYVIRALTGIQDLKVIDVKTQYSIRNIGGHSVILDCYAEDSERRVHNIEIQVKNNDNQPKRMRYYRSAIDYSILEKGCDYEDLPDVYMIFISSFDMFGLGKTKYCSKKVVDGTDYVINDGVHELYFNTAIDDGSDISELMRYFKHSDPKNEKFGALSQAVRYQKETEKGVGSMCTAVEEYCVEREKRGIQQGISQGISQTKNEIAKNLLKDGMPVEKIAKITELSLEEVKALVKE